MKTLPLFVERSLQQVQADRAELSTAFESKILAEHPISCARKCAACCYYPVFISVLEGMSIYRHLVAHGHWTPSLKKKLEQAAETTTDLSIQVWLLTKIACPLLANNECLAYDARPFACRTTVATGDPYHCDSQRLGPQTSIVPRTEISEEFHKREKLLLRKHKLMHLTIPVGRAVLLAEQVCAGELMLENVDAAYVRSYFSEKTP